MLFFLLELLIEHGLVVTLIALLHGPHAPHHEHLSDALLALATSSAGARRQCCDASNKLQPLLKERTALLQDKDEFEVSN